MIKKILCILLTVLTCFSFVMCTKESQDTDTDSSDTSSESEKSDETDPPDNGGDKKDDDEKDGTEDNVQPRQYKLSSSTQGVRILGVRNLASDSQINCDWSCSGIEFGIKLDSGNVRFLVTASSRCYFRAYVDGIPWNNNGSEYYTVSTDGMLTLNGITPGEHIIKLVKVTGYTLARSEIKAVIFAGSILEEPLADKERYIEFVGDSITCGWGTIGDHAGAYTDQDGTLAYSYLLAEALDADYSMTALSGQGLLCGNPGVASAYEYACIAKDATTKYSFERKADLVVVNIGTNDFAKQSELGITASSFKDAYVNFLKTVREANGSSCRILCLYNTMNDTFADAIKEACNDLGGESKGIYSMELKRAEGNRHPTIEEHKAYAEALKEIVTRLSESFTSSLTVIDNGDGDNDSYNFQFPSKQ